MGFTKKMALKNDKGGGGEPWSYFTDNDVYFQLG